MTVAAYEDRHWLSAAGVRLHYRDYAGDPTKTPVLCIPGLTRNARDFEGVAARLAGTRRVIAVDLRGRGLSERAADPLTYMPPVYLQDLLGLITGHSLAPMAVFGTSLGGILAMLMGLAARPVLAGVLLNDIGPVLEADGISRIQSYVGKDLRFADWDEAAQGIAATHAGAFPEYGAAEWLIWARRVCRETDAGEIVFDYDMNIAVPFKQPPPEPAFDLWPAFETLRDLPGLLVRGERSDVLGARTAMDMIERVPTMEFVTLPKIGHAPTLEEPEVVAAIDRLLARVDYECSRNPI